MSPTIMRAGKYRFFFYSREEKRPHIHVRTAEKEAKFWLNPIELVENYGYNNNELNEIFHLINGHKEFLLAKWGGFHGS
ncbi:MAG: DUF4160 domain-containing protein [Thermoanaerobacteraceae bacterium]|nr:DUF4160 domain-containing protein [Thermoanaerobacteraceae bacterium]